MKVKLDIIEADDNELVMELDEFTIRNFLAVQGEKFTDFQWALLTDLMEISKSNFIIKKDEA